jgi:hypothetical protein
MLAAVVVVETARQLRAVVPLVLVVRAAVVLDQQPQQQPLELPIQAVVEAVLVAAIRQTQTAQQAAPVS